LSASRKSPVPSRASLPPPPVDPFLPSPFSHIDQLTTRPDRKKCSHLIHGAVAS
jgi:hypothetical protein